jgi:NADH dehydrogenase
LPQDCIGRGNRIKVDQFNRVGTYENVFAIGDIALMSGDEKNPNGHPQVAQVALQQGALLAKNLKRKILHDKPFKPFTYSDKGSMATIGRNRAVVDLPFLHLRGLVAWFMWLFVHLMAIAGFRSKTVILMNWIWNYFTYDRATRLIIRPFLKDKAAFDEKSSA